MFDRIRNAAVPILAVVLCLFTLAEVNFPRMQNQSELAFFVMLGLILCFFLYPARKAWEENKVARGVDLALIALTVLACGYVIVQSEPLFSGFWSHGQSLGDRAGIETGTDFVIGVLGILLVLEATRRSIGWIVPILAMLFMAHSYLCSLYPRLPTWMLAHGGQDIEWLVASTWSQSLGIFGVAAGVMFKFVFLFVIFGAFLQMSGATQFIIDFAKRVFGRSPGGPAKVSVLGSGLMGSLSGSAVANAVTTGAFTIPMMRSAGFQPHVAGGITAAAASGGALVPPVMGAGAYMMLELVQPEVTFLQVAKAALIPAILYYLSIFMIVHFYARRVGTVAAVKEDAPRISIYQGLVFFAALGSLVLLLVLGSSAFKAVTGSLVVILVLTMANPTSSLPAAARRLALGTFAVLTLVLAVVFISRSAGRGVDYWIESLIDAGLVGMLGLLVFSLAHPGLREAVLNALQKAAKDGTSLIAASACVGLIIGVVQVTGIATDFSAVIKSVVSQSLFIALVGIMICSIILGMGVPSVVCYLLMATLMGSLLDQMGVQPLAAHLFIFYFGMMSMVTPPVALAAYASASIAGSNIMRTATASFRFALVGFTLPFMFVYRPALLLLHPEAPTSGKSLPPGLKNQGLDFTQGAHLLELSLAVGTAVLGIVSLAASLAGYLLAPLSMAYRVVLFVAAALLLSPDLVFGDINYGPYMNGVATALFIMIAVLNWRSGKGAGAASGDLSTVAEGNA